MKIENQEIATQVMFKLNKVDNDFTQKELDNITELFLDYNSLQETSFNLRHLTLFTNIKDLTFINFNFSNYDLNVLNKIKTLQSLTFDRCHFKEASILKDFKLISLSLINCNINNYDFIYKMKSLKMLSIVKGSILLNNLNKLNKLEFLQLSASNIEDVKSKLKIKSLKNLYINNTPIIDLSNIQYIKNLNILSLSQNQFDANKLLLEPLMKNGLTIKNEGMVNFEVGGE